MNQNMVNGLKCNVGRHYMRGVTVQASTQCGKEFKDPKIDLL